MTDNIIVDPAGLEHEEVEEIEINSDPDLPEKYKGKSLSDIVEMHRNAETELGRRANEVGHYRSLIDDLIDVKRSKDLSDNPDEDVEPIKPDDLLADPEGVLSKVIDRALDKRIKPLEASRAKDSTDKAVETFYNDFPDADTIAQDPDFHEFILRKPSRIADAKAASNKDGMDLTAARRLLENYTDFKESTKTVKDEGADDDTGTDDTPTGVKGARKVATETSGDSSPPGKKFMYQSEVVDLMIKNPEKYRSDSYQKSLMKAIKEGRLRK